MVEQHRERGAERIENGERGEVRSVSRAGEVLIEFDVTGRTRTLSGEDLAKLRLGYAQHIHRAQGATVTRTLVLTGGWQTSKEPAYVEASRARRGGDWFVSRDDLGREGQDAERVQRLAQSMGRSRSQIPSLAYPELEPYSPELLRTIGPTDLRLPGFARALHQLAQPQAQPEKDPMSDYLDPSAPRRWG